MPEAQTLLDLLRPDREDAPGQALRFFEKPGVYREVTIGAFRQLSLARLGTLQAAGVPAGSEVVMPVAEPEAFLSVFWACLLGGYIAMPLAPPTNASTCAKIVDILERRPDALLCIEDAGFERLVEAVDPEVAAALSQRRVAFEECSTPGKPVDRTADDMAFVQYSSGSTRAPKGVIIRHGQALANLRAITAGAELNASDVTFSWMPLSHDMGLVGFHLSPLFAGATQVLMPTSAFARTPLVWLQDASAQRATILSSPNFGYRHTLKSLARKGLPEGVDLSAVRLIMNGAEPISVALAEEFLDELGCAGLSPTAMLPVYGLAEATLAVTFPALGSRIAGVRLARSSSGLGDAVQRVRASESADAAGEGSFVACGCGVPLPGLEVRIVGEDGGAVAEEHIGRVWIRGAGVTEGYHDDPEATAAAVMGEGWLDTGDLGFLSGGELHITGRRKDLVIVSGQNFYPHDLEESLQVSLGVDALRVAVAPVRRLDAPEEIGVFIVHRGDKASFEDTAGAVRRHLSEAFGVGVDLVVPVPDIPRTTSGKIQRQRLATRLLGGEFGSEYLAASGELVPAGAADEAGSGVAPGSEDRDGEARGGGADESPAGLEAMMLAACTQVLGEERFGPTDNLFEQGMSSIDLAEIHGLIEARYPKGLDIRDFFDAPTVRGLAELLAQRLASGDAAAVTNG